MWSVSTLVLLCGVWTVNAEGHSLTYIYTAFTRPVHLPGIHEFSAMGLLDGRPIDYYDSSTKVKVPKEDWMRERLDKDYWDKGTSSRQTKQQWFKVNLDILTDRLRKNGTENHVLQWRHGCVINTEGSSEMVHGIDQYSYDGDDFLSFDSQHKIWVAPMTEALPTKRKWDGIQQLNDYTEGYLHNECIQWLNTFLKYRNEANIKAVPPKVYISAKPVKNNLRLSCLATGFRPKEITMKIMRDGHLVTRPDGLESTGVRPNGDGTHQIKMWVLIPGSDTAKYTCEIHHPASNVHVVEEWDHKVIIEGPSIGLTVGAAIGGVLVLAIIITGVGIIILRRKKTDEKVVTILPLSRDETAPLTVAHVQKAQGKSDEDKKLLNGSESSGISSGSSAGSGSSSSLEKATV